MVACINVANGSGNYNSGWKRKVTQQSTYISEKRKKEGFWNGSGSIIVFTLGLIG